jgi:hypothetical protein
MSAADDVRRVLAAWRDKHGWQPGMVWNPYTGRYEHVPAQGGATPKETP